MSDNLHFRNICINAKTKTIDFVDPFGHDFTTQVRQQVQNYCDRHNGNGKWDIQDMVTHTADRLLQLWDLVHLDNGNMDAILEPRQHLRNIRKLLPKTCSWTDRQGAQDSLLQCTQGRILAPLHMM